MQHTAPMLVVVAIAVALPACAPSEPPPPPDTSLHSEALGITLDAVPEDLRVVENADPLVLEPAADATEGRIVVETGPVEDNPNLVAAVHDHEERIRSLQEGDYKGARELQGPLGAAFYSRGRFARDGRALEETKVFALHPSGDRLLVLTSTYPAGEDSSARVTQLINLLAQVE